MYLICGEALFDVFIAAETATGLTLDARIGGSPWNVALGLARLGQPAAFLTGLAADALGERLCRAVTAEGVDTRHLVRKPLLTTLALVDLGQGGHARYSFYNQGAADAALTEADLPGLDGIGAVHFGSYSLVTEPTGASFLTLARRARAQGCLVSLDPNLRLSIAPDLSLWQERVAAFLGLAHLVKASDEDIATLHPGREPLDVAREWAARGPALVVVTRGAGGLVAVSRAGEVHAPARAATVIDTVGAGDTVQAALLTGLAELGAATPAGLTGLGPEDVSRLLAFAAAAAAITVSRRGADLPRRADLPPL